MEKLNALNLTDTTWPNGIRFDTNSRKEIEKSFIRLDVINKQSGDVLRHN